MHVDDTRGGSLTAGWVVSVVATAFTPSSGAALATGATRYSPGAITQIRGAAAVTDDTPGDLTAAAAAAAAGSPRAEPAATTPS